MCEMAIKAKDLSMYRAWMPLAVMAVVCCGCTTDSLKHYTLTQNRTGGEARDRSVLDCLAAVAANRDILPSFSIYSAGVATVTDSLTLGDTVWWTPATPILEVLALTGSRSPKGQWTVDPAVEYERLEAMQAACWWVLEGPEIGVPAYSQILGDPAKLLDNKPHFGVDWRFERIRPGWLCIGSRREVPACARYTGHYCDTWVWVMPDQTDSFAEFTLVLQDIATLDPTIITPPPILVQLTRNKITKLPDPADKTKKETIATTEIRAVKMDYRDTIDKAIREGLKTGKGVDLSQRQWIDYTDPWFGQRTGNTVAAAPSLTGRAQPTELPGIPFIPGRGESIRFEPTQSPAIQPEQRN
jgi:hypothetical protein